MTGQMKVSRGRASLVQHTEHALAKALSSMTGKEFSVAAIIGNEGGDLAEPIVWEQVFSHSPDPAMWLAAGRELLTAVGEATLAAVGIDAPTDEDCRATWTEIAGQTMGAIATAITTDLEREITAVRGAPHEPPSETVWTPFAASIEGGGRWYLKAAWSPALISLYDAQENREKPEVMSSAFSKTFDLLLDVALPVSVSFGKTSLQIREVLKLNTGSIVELNRFVAEPVDVVVNNCVIARGEVVVVDGNYGVRVTHLASREERLRSGRVEVPIRMADAPR
jgi:flagellar motor switch protein FliN/FliY